MAIVDLQEQASEHDKLLRMSCHGEQNYPSPLMGGIDVKLTSFTLLPLVPSWSSNRVYRMQRFKRDLACCYCLVFVTRAISITAVPGIILVQKSPPGTERPRNNLITRVSINSW